MNEILTPQELEEYVRKVLYMNKYSQKQITNIVESIAEILNTEELDYEAIADTVYAYIKYKNKDVDLNIVKGLIRDIFPVRDGVLYV